MGVGDLDLMSALKTRMQWHQARQKLIAENVANADTPHFKAKDLKEPSLPGDGGASRTAATGFTGTGATGGAGRVAAVHLAATAPGHLTGGGPSGFRTDTHAGFEVRPSGNAVNLEDEMAKSAENQLDYQTAASLYQQSLALIRTAIGRK